MWQSEAVCENGFLFFFLLHFENQMLLDLDWTIVPCCLDLRGSSILWQPLLPKTLVSNCFSPIKLWCVHLGHKGAMYYKYPYTNEEFTNHSQSLLFEGCTLILKIINKHRCKNLNKHWINLYTFLTFVWVLTVADVCNIVTVIIYEWKYTVCHD